MIINSVNIQHYDTNTISDRKISNVERHKPPLSSNKLDKKTLDIGDTDIYIPNIFHSANRHTYVSSEDLSEKWCVRLKTAQETLKKTTQKFLHSALLPLFRRY